MSRYEFLKISNAWLSHFDLTGDETSFEEFVSVVINQMSVDIESLRDFIEDTNDEIYFIFGPWSVRHFEKIRRNPRLLRDFTLLSFPGYYNLIIGYGVWCLLNNIRIEYVDNTGRRLIDQDTEFTIESRKSTSGFIEDCIRDNAIITVLARLLVPLSEIDYEDQYDDCFTYDYIMLFDRDNNPTGTALRRLRLFSSRLYYNRYDLLESIALYGNNELVDIFLKLGIEMPSSMIIPALIGGHFELTERLINLEVEIPVTTIYAGIVQQYERVKRFVSVLKLTDIFKYVSERLSISLNLSQDRDIIVKYAIDHNNLELLEYAYEIGTFSHPLRKPFIDDLDFNEDYFEIESFMPIIRFLCKHDYVWRDPRDPWRELGTETEFFLTAIDMGYTNNSGKIIPEDSLKELIELGCSFRDCRCDILKSAIIYRSLDFVKFLFSRGYYIPGFRDFVFALERRMKLKPGFDISEWIQLFKDIGGRIDSVDFIYPFGSNFRLISRSEMEVESNSFKIAIELNVPYDLNNIIKNIEKIRGNDDLDLIRLKYLSTETLSDKTRIDAFILNFLEILKTRT